MMLTIHGLPSKVKYQDLKNLIKQKCNVHNFILDNLVPDGFGVKKVRVGVTDEKEGEIFLNCLNGFRFGGNILRVVPVQKTSTIETENSMNYDKQGGYNGPPSQAYGNHQVNQGMAWAPNNYQSQGVLLNTAFNHQQVPQEMYPTANTSQQQPQNYRFLPNTNQDQRPHVLKTVEIVDNPVHPAKGVPARSPSVNQGYGQHKPMTISKENFQGPTQFNVNSLSRQSHGQMQFPDSIQSWKPTPGPTDNRHHEMSRSLDHSLQDRYKQGPEFSFHNRSPHNRRETTHGHIVLPSARKMSPKRRVSPLGMKMSPAGRKMSPIGRRMSPPGRRMSPPERRMTPPGRRMSPRGRITSPSRMSPPRRRMSSPEKKLAPPGRRISLDRRVSPGRRISPSQRNISPGGHHVIRHHSPGPIHLASPPNKRPVSPVQWSLGRRESPPRQIPRYSPSRQYKRIEKYSTSDSRSKDVRPAYDVPLQASKQVMYSGSYHSSDDHAVGEGRKDSRITLLETPRGHDPRKAIEQLLEPRSRSPIRKSRSPIRRDRSPIRDRYKRHSPSPRSPRRSWALEKRRSPEAREAPPPPIWPGQNSRDEYHKLNRPDIQDRHDIEDKFKHLLVWEQTFVARKNEERRHPEEERAKIRVRDDLHVKNVHREPSPHDHFFKQHENFPSTSHRESKYSPSEEFTHEYPRQHFERSTDLQDFKRSHVRDGRYHDGSLRSEEYSRHSEERKDYRFDPVDFNKEIDEVRKKASDYSKKFEQYLDRHEKVKDFNVVPDISKGIQARRSLNVNRHTEHYEKRMKSYEHEDLQRREQYHRDLRKITTPKRPPHQEDFPMFNSERSQQPLRGREVDRSIDNVLKSSTINTMKTKRNKVIEEITQDILKLQKLTMKDKLLNRINQELRFRVSRIINEMFGNIDISFIEMLVKFNSRYDDKFKKNLLEEVSSAFSSEIRNPKRPASEIISEKSKVVPKAPVLAKQPRLAESAKNLQKGSEAKPLPAKSETEKAVAELKSELHWENNADNIGKSPKNIESAHSAADYELNSLMSRILQNELQDVMIKMWQELPDQPRTPEEQLVAEKFRNEMADDLRDVLGLNVTKRLLNTHNPLYVRIKMSHKPTGEAFSRFVNDYKMSRCTLVDPARYLYRGKFSDIEHYDKIVTETNLRCGNAKVAVVPCYNFSRCPVNIKTNFVTQDFDNKTSDEEKNLSEVPKEKITIAIKKQELNKTSFTPPTDTEPSTISIRNESAIKNNVNPKLGTEPVTKKIITQDDAGKINTDVNPNSTKITSKKDSTNIVSTKSDSLKSITIEREMKSTPNSFQSDKEMKSETVSKTISKAESETNNNKLEAKLATNNESKTVVPKFGAVVKSNVTNSATSVENESNSTIVFKSGENTSKITVTKVDSKNKSTTEKSEVPKVNIPLKSFEKTKMNAIDSTKQTNLKLTEQKNVVDKVALFNKTPKTVKTVPVKSLDVQIKRPDKAIISKTSSKLMSKNSLDVEGNEELNDEEILALISQGIILDECGTDEE